MDEFVNWDQADPAPVLGAPGSTQCLLPVAGQPMDDIDLALANVDGDEFSFWALEHFENNLSPTLALDEDIPMPTDRCSRTFEDHLEHPNDPCTDCRANGYHCKKIPEGQYKGYCTSCVALRKPCSFGFDPVSPSHHVMADHPELPHEDTQGEPLQRPTSAPGFCASAHVSEDASAQLSSKAKAGARFSRESVKILKTWLSTHSKHPYPNDEEKEMLQKQTGLSKTQITNWLANTRRRNKNSIHQRSTSPGVRSWANPIDIPQRRRSLENMNPLQRWQHSPPENEPASVRDIARAVNSASSLSSGLNSPYSAHFTDDGSGRSCCDSNISSANTSGSSASVFSYGSRGSFGSGGSMPRGRRRRRRKVQAATGAPAPSGPAKTFQCTFCTETFRTKHDWQRHEKSLHLSLERWICSPNGALAFCPENGQMSCVFCGQANPDETHIDSHNHSACQERSLGERTFYRKDHLRQHLKLVHDAKFASWSMEQWKATTPEIRSRCGFCGTVMDSWSIRVDHLAAHFKEGKDMAQWVGDWGFDAPVLDMVENSIPPYLIHHERNSPNPFEASRPSEASARNAFELIKSELTFHIDERREKDGKFPTDDELQRMACALIYDAEEAAQAKGGLAPSWLRDLLFSSDQVTREAKWTRSKGAARWQQLKINGKGNIFELDPMEQQLQEYVKARNLLGLTPMDSELQAEALLIIRRMQAMSEWLSDDFAKFLIRLVNGSTAWLAPFRKRAQLPRSEDVGDEAKRSNDPTTIDSTIHNFSRLESELAEYVREQWALGLEPTDADLQTKARHIIYAGDFDDAWNQTAADDPMWLASFKERQFSTELNNGPLFGSQFPTSQVETDMWNLPQQSAASSSKSPAGGSISPFDTSRTGSVSAAPGAAPLTKAASYFLNDANCYQRLARELKKWVASTMSPNNPNFHIPTDLELQHQARWIIYEDDDPWNQTAADNAEWLRRFKRDVGLLTDPSLPGLPSTLSWNLAQGGSGFSPPYLFPNPNTHTAPFSASAAPTAAGAGAGGSASSTAVGGTDPEPMISVTMCDGGKPFAAHAAAADRFCAALANRTEPPPSVFCSRELERELAGFVAEQVVLRGREGFPGDEAIRERARAWMRVRNGGAGVGAGVGSDDLAGGAGAGAGDRTPADDEVLLRKFREMMMVRLGLSDLGAAATSAQQQGQGVLGAVGGLTAAAAPAVFGMGQGLPAVAGADLGLGLGLTPNLDLVGGGAGMDDVLQQMDFDFGDLGDFMGVATGGMPMDH